MAALRRMSLGKRLSYPPVHVGEDDTRVTLHRNDAAVPRLLPRRRVRRP